MAYVEDYNYDIFVSYAHKDNEEKKWITNFIDYFKSLLLESDVSANIFIDYKKLIKIGGLHTNLMEAIEESAMLLVVLSTSYLTSEYCKEEREYFYTQYHNDPLFKKRLIILQKNEIIIDNNILSVESRFLVDNVINYFFGYDFSCWDFIHNTYKLSQDVIEVLNNIRKKTIVFIAKPEGNKTFFRRAKVILERKGYRIYTGNDILYKNDEAMFKEEITNQLLQADLYIHTFFNKKVSNYSILQFELAKKTGIKCMLYIKGDLKFFLDQQHDTLKKIIKKDECYQHDFDSFIKEICNTLGPVQISNQTSFSNNRVLNFIDYMEKTKNHLSNFVLNK